MQRVVNAFVVALLGAASFSAYAIAPKYEVRAVWLETIWSLDWPSSTTPSEQKTQLCEILDKLAAANFNTVLFQAQSQGDVAWISTIQPAMREITGSYTSGLTYDVAQYVIDECHKRNMECHATILPYRLGSATRANYYNQNGIKHPYVTNPELCLTYNNQLYFDPGNPGTNEYLINLYRELIRNYNFDGVSFDYCRYVGDYDDADSYSKYNPQNLSKDDWRRNNINTFIAEFYDMVQEENPHVKVGAAPVGTYKNPSGFHNNSAYYNCYQDACQWVQSGHCDTLYPQLYFDETYGFTQNIGIWVDGMNGRQMVAGLAPYKMVDNNWAVSVITSQMETVRNHEGTNGFCYFRTNHVIDQSQTKIAQLYSELQNNYFKYPAHVPPMEYKVVTKPSAPQNVRVVRDGSTYHISWEAPELDANNTPIKYYCIYRAKSGLLDKENMEYVVKAKHNGLSIDVDAETDSDEFAVTAFDDNNYESDAVLMAASVDGIEQDCDIVVAHRDGVLSVVSPSIIASVELFSASGKCVSAVLPNAISAEIDCSTFGKGIYVVKIVADRRTVVRKIVI